MRLPFHYEVRFRLLAYKDNNNIEIQSSEKKFESQNYLEAREEAFCDFQEYLFFKKSNNLLNEVDGNDRIINPHQNDLGLILTILESLKALMKRLLFIW